LRVKHRVNSNLQSVFVHTGRNFDGKFLVTSAGRVEALSADSVVETIRQRLRADDSDDDDDAMQAGSLSAEL
jgi:hypothetical protein